MGKSGINGKTGKYVVCERGSNPKSKMQRSNVVHNPSDFNRHLHHHQHHTSPRLLRAGAQSHIVCLPSGLRNTVL